jgi:mRNA interferase MazF
LIRITVEPSPANGLRNTSQVMVDKAQTVSREKIGHSFGRLDDTTLLEVTRSPAVFIGIA